MSNLKNITSLTLYFFLLVCLSNCTNNNRNKIGNLEDTSDALLIGWSSIDITPDKPVLIQGQYHARVSEGVMDPVTATVLALESIEGQSSEKAILISCDLCTISDGMQYGANDNLNKTLGERLTAIIPGLSVDQIIINATHTHAGPHCSSHKSSGEIYGVELNALTPYECLEYISDRIAKAAEQAWVGRKPGGISYGLGHAVVSHNRLQTDFTGKSKIYDNTNTADFSHIEGYEDHSVNLLYTWDRNKKLTGVVINVASPSQVSGLSYLISADYWHDTRVELHNRLGDDIFILPQCSAAGDQSPHLMLGMKAEERMQQLMFPESESGRGRMGRRKQIAQYIADAVTSVLPYMKDNIVWDPVFDLQTEAVELSRRLISSEEVKKASLEAEELKKQYDQLISEIKENPGIKEDPRWYNKVTVLYNSMMRYNRVKVRYEMEKTQPKMPVKVHVLRIGDIVMATNPFELYLDYGLRIKARSPAVQTFLVQLAGSGTYLPTTRSVQGGAYGAVPHSTLIGPEGGQELVEKTLEMINRVLEKQ